MIEDAESLQGRGQEEARAGRGEEPRRGADPLDREVSSRTMRRTSVAAGDKPDVEKAIADAQGGPEVRGRRAHQGGKTNALAQAAMKIGEAIYGGPAGRRRRWRPSRAARARRRRAARRRERRRRRLRGSEGRQEEVGLSLVPRLRKRTEPCQAGLVQPATRRSRCGNGAGRHVLEGLPCPAPKHRYRQYRAIASDETEGPALNMAKRDYYEMLGLARGASEQDSSRRSGGSPRTAIPTAIPATSTPSSSSRS